MRSGLVAAVLGRGRRARRVGVLRRRRLRHRRDGAARDGRRDRRGARRRRLVAGRVALPRLDRAGLVGGRAPRSASSPGRASRSGGRSRATARGTRSRRASSCSPSASSASPPALLPGRPLRTLALLLAALLGAVLVWALLGKAIPALGPDDAGRVARLKGSIGYWNALALLADAALGARPLAARRGPRALRAAGRRAARSTRRRS